MGPRSYRAAALDVAGRVGGDPAAVHARRQHLTFVLAHLIIEEPVQLGVHRLEEGGVLPPVERQVLELVRVRPEVEQLDLVEGEQRIERPGGDCAACPRSTG
ncbi:MAG TPA: hypothetical protein VMH40_01365 [Myxococcaceae bacterium]|nr:hypothetical protein [Myxococcaceae bacterium]